MSAVAAFYRQRQAAGFRWRAPGFGLLVLGATAFLHGQEALYVRDDAVTALVMGVRDGTALIARAGKLVKADSHVYMLRKSPEFEPVLISVNRLHTEINSVVTNEGTELNHNLNLHARLESGYDLENVYLALEVNAEQLGKLIYIQEVGNIGPHQPQTIALSIPFVGKISGDYYIHLYVQGNEVLNSTIPEAARDLTLDRMVAKRTAGARDRPLRPFVGPSPEFPPALRATQTSGQAVVHIRVDARGRVFNPTVFSASDPAFGAAALAAIRQWRFLPEVSHGTPVPSSVAVPFRFAL